MKNSNKKQPTRHQQVKNMVTVIGKAKAAICEHEGHNWQPQFTGTPLIHKVCSKCGAEKFE